MDIHSFSELAWQGWLTLGVVVMVFVILATNRMPADFAFLGGLTILLVSGVLNAQNALSGFASSAMITVGVLYVIVAGLQETGGIAWISRKALGRPDTTLKAQAKLVFPITVLSAFLNNTPVVAMFIPVVKDWCRRIHIPPSQLMIPLSYASIFGGACTLIGTSTNLVVNGMMQDRFDSKGMSMFEIGKLGLPCALFGIGYILLLSRKILPNKSSLEEVLGNPREYTLELAVTPDGSLVGSTIEKAGLRRLAGSFIAELIRDDQVIPVVSPNEVLQGGDRLIFVGNRESMVDLQTVNGLQPAPGQIFKLDAPRHQRCLVEAVVSDTCPLVGQTIRQGCFRNVYNAVVIAVARNGQRLQGRIGDIRLKSGDTLLIESHAGFVPRQKDSRDFFLVSEVQNYSPRQFEKAPLAFGILLAMVTAVALGWITMLNGALLAGASMLFFKCCTPTQARRSIEWNILLVIAGALGIGAAMEQTGVASAMAGTVLSIVGDHPWAALAGVYFLTSLTTEAINNNGAAALMFPFAVTLAAQLNVNPMPFIACIMIGASASFATPIGYQTNLMVYGPGGYKFSDYLRFGIPLNILTGVVAVTLAPFIWPF